MILGNLADGPAGRQKHDLKLFHPRGQLDQGTDFALQIEHPRQLSGVKSHLMESGDCRILESGVLLFCP